jgi:hypothetical protein
MLDRAADPKSAGDGELSPENDFEEPLDVHQRSDEDAAIAARQFTVAGVVCTKQRRLVDDTVDAAAAPSYASNSLKELLCLEYIAGFQRQFESLFPSRRPLYLHPPNEKGIPKFVCTTLRPTLLPQRELYDCHALARFLAGAVEYEPLENPIKPPTCLPSPSFTLKCRAGDSFDMATLLTSFLIGAGYDAFVVHGTAPRWICLMDQSKSPLPVLPVEEGFWKAHEATGTVNEQENAGKDATDVTLVSRSKFTSKYMEKQREQAEKEARSNGRRMFQDYRAADDDDDDPLEGKRVHAWVLVRAGKRDVPEHFFLEATTGTRYSLREAPYVSIEAVWNHENYWVNMQPHPVYLTLFDLANPTDWEFIFLSPAERRAAKEAGADAKDGLDLAGDLKRLGADSDNQADGDTDGEEDLVLDIPPSWVNKLEIDRATFKKQFVTDAQRVTLFHRAKVEEFAENSHEQGLVMRVTLFRDTLCTLPVEIREYFKNRKDKLECRKRYPFEGKFEEYFAPGRMPEALKARTEWIGYRREFLFYTSARPDGLVKREEDIQKRMTEYYDGRDDLLVYRSVVLATEKDDVDSKNPYVLPGGSAGEIAIKKMKEKLARNPAVPADEDQRKRTYNVLEGFVRVNFHYATGKITAGSRTYHKTVNTPVDVVMADPSAKKPKASILEDELRASIQVRVVGFRASTGEWRGD